MIENIPGELFFVTQTPGDSVITSLRAFSLMSVPLASGGFEK